MQRIVLGLLPMLVVGFTGCASYTQNTLALRNSLAGGNYENALQSISGARKSPAKLLYLLENGLVAHYQGSYNRSNTFFDRAEKLADKLFTRSISREAAAFLTNDAVRSYRGEEFEMVFIHYYRAMNYWYLGLPEDALVECRKANLRLSRFTSLTDADEAYKNDAFIHYMTGLFYEATGEPNDAYISYRDARKAYDEYPASMSLEAPKTLDEDLARIERELDFDISPVGQSSTSRILNGRVLPEGELILFSEIGFVPQKIQEEISLPIYDSDLSRAHRGSLRNLSVKIAHRHSRPYYPGVQKVKYWLRVALPAYEDAKPGTRNVRISAAGRTTRSIVAQDFSAIAWQTFQDKQPAIIARTVARGLTKYIATEKIKKKSKVLGFLSNLFVAATEVADTSSWVSLPHNIQIGRLHLPVGDHDITIESLDAWGHVTETRTIVGVRIDPGSKTFVNHRTYR
jgi:hypothetical protein